MINWLRGLFAHRHRWERYYLRNEIGRPRLYFCCRRCPCGADEIQRAGPMGDGSWLPRELGSQWDGPLVEWEANLLALAEEFHP